MFVLFDIKTFGLIVAHWPTFQKYSILKIVVALLQGYLELNLLKKSQSRFDDLAASKNFFH